MKQISYIFVVFLSIFAAGFVRGGKTNESGRIEPTDSIVTLSDEGHQCRPWFFYNTATKQCECYRSPATEGIVTCTEHGALLKYGFCMTHKKGQGTFIGRCQYFEIKGHNVSNSPGFITLPDNVSELNEYMCGPLNRKGLICSECVDNFGPSATFFGYSCSNCSSAWYGIPFYLLLEFVPVTVFYLIILFFQIGFTSAPFTAFALYSQIAVYGVTIVFGPYSFETSPIVYYFSLAISFYGIWNLDFFRYIIPPFCLSSRLRIIHIVLLNYISAFYPLCLVGLTWVCIELHSRNFKLFIWIWSKLDKLCCTRRANGDNKSAVIDVFSTFLLLSYTKIVAVFIATIEPDDLVSMHGNSTQRVLYVDPSVEWLGTDNLPIVIISFFLFLVLILPPTLLLALYPNKKFRYLLLKCSFSGHTKAALNIFVEKFYSCYRDGLDGGRDMRGLASLYFIIRIVVYLLSIGDQFLMYDALVIGGTAIFIAVVRPYKKTYMNVIDTLLLAALAFTLVMFDLYFRERLGSPTALFYALNIGVVGSFPMWGLFAFIVYKILSSKRVIIKLHSLKVSLSKISCCRAFSDKEEVTTAQQEVTIEHSELPDRVLNPEEYSIEISATQKPTATSSLSIH